MHKHWIVAIAALGCITGASALTVTGTATLGCDSWEGSSDAGATGTRDTMGISGSPSEFFQVRATDAAGVELFSLDMSVIVGGTLTYPGTHSYSASPTYNPITFKVTSLAGNGFAEEVAYQTTGTCAGLPTVAPVIPSPVAVPTMDLAGLGALTGLLGAAGAFWQRRRRTNKKPC